MGATHLDRGGVSTRHAHDGLDGRLEVGQQAGSRGLHLQREGRVDDVRAGQPEVQEAALRPDGLGDLADEGDDVMVGRALQLLDAGDVDPGSLLDDRDRVGRHLSATRLGARDRQLDPQHGPEARLVGPDGRHLGQGVARDHRAVPAGVGTSAASDGVVGRRIVAKRRQGVDRLRRDRQAADVAATLDAGEVDQRRGRLGHGCGSAHIGTQADDGQDAATGRHQAAIATAGHAGMEDPHVGRLEAGGVEAVDRRAGDGRLGIARRGQDHGRGRLVGRRQAAVTEAHGRGGIGQAILRRCQQQRRQRDRQARQDGLRLRVAEAGVELEQAGAAGGQHQPREERALERAAAPGELGQDRAMDGAHDGRHLRVGQLGRRRDRAHAAGVRAGVTVADPLVVARGGQRQRGRGVADGDGARFRPLERPLDDDARAGGAEGPLDQHGADGPTRLVQACRRRRRPCRPPARRP